MSGRIRTIHIFTHGLLIIRLYGFVVFLRAVKIAFKGGTFLEAVYGK